MAVTYDGAYRGTHTIEELADALKKFNYTPRTEAERRKEAEGAYAGALQTALESANKSYQDQLAALGQQRDAAMRQAQQGYASNDTALQNQLVGLADAYNRQVQDQQRATAQAISQSDRRALGRGMQRSTYNQSTLNNLQLKGDEAVRNIQQDRTNAETKIGNQRSLLTQQLNEAMANAENDYQAGNVRLQKILQEAMGNANKQYQNNVAQRMQELSAEDIQRQLEADQYVNSIQLQLYQLQKAEDEKRAAEAAQAQAAAAASASAGGGGGYGGGSSGGGSASKASSGGSGSGGGNGLVQPTQPEAPTTPPRDYGDVVTPKAVKSPVPGLTVAGFNDYQAPYYLSQALADGVKNATNAVNSSPVGRAVAGLIDNVASAAAETPLGKAVSSLKAAADSTGFTNVANNVVNALTNLWKKAEQAGTNTNASNSNGGWFVNAKGIKSSKGLATLSKTMR